MNADALRGGVAAFFDLFVKAFASFRGPEVAALYFVPCIALRGDGSVQVVDSRGELERFFQVALDGYSRDGARVCRFHDLEVVPLGGRSAVGTVTWDLLREDGDVVRTWRQSYNLLRVGDGWQVLASTYHLP